MAPRLLFDENLAARLVGLLRIEYPGSVHVWRGFPPKVIWIQLGNCSTDNVARLLRDAQTLIADFVAHPDAAFLPLRARNA